MYLCLILLIIHYEIFNVMEKSEPHEKNSRWFLSIIIQSYIDLRRTLKTLLAKLFK